MLLAGGVQAAFVFPTKEIGGDLGLGRIGQRPAASVPGFCPDGYKMPLLVLSPRICPAQSAPSGPGFWAEDCLSVISNRRVGTTTVRVVHNGQPKTGAIWTETRGGITGSSASTPQKSAPTLFFVGKTPETSDPQQKEGVLLSGLLLIFNLSQPNGPVYSAAYPSPR